MLLSREHGSAHLQEHEDQMSDWVRLRFGKSFRLPLRRRYGCSASSGRLDGRHTDATTLELTLRFLHDSHARWTPVVLLAL